MKYIRGFLMALGNFSALPCPYHKWHEDARKAMLCMLPLVGTLLGLLVAVAWAALDWLGVPGFLTGVLLTAFYFCGTGFIHLDGFMDCSDAILSRRPELAERQRILKDSAVGAFAVIAVVLMFLVFAASMAVLTAAFSFRRVGVLVMILTLSRGVAADYVGRKPAMKTSQYAGGKFTSWESLVLNALTVLPVLVFSYMIDFGQEEPFGYFGYFVGTIAVVLIAANAVGVYDRKQLGGMSGDIAGHMIVSSEVIGVAVMAVLASSLGI